MVDTSICSLKVAASGASIATFVALLAGRDEITVGGEVSSPGPAVVNVEVN
jgi:hypothetical protein